MDHQLILNVSSDLQYLAEEWTQDIDDHSLRRTSPILRNLLVEGHLARIANYLREEIMLNAPTICKNEKLICDPYLKFYQCGGATYKGRKIRFITLLNRSSPEEDKRSYESEKELAETTYFVPLQKYIDQISFVIECTPIKRHEVIKYVANKLGGAHFDSSRKASELEKKYCLMDKIRDGITVGDKNAIYYELLSIGQAIVNSSDVKRIRKIITPVN